MTTILLSIAISCQFGLYNAPIINTQTELGADREIGNFSYVAYQGSPSKKIPNLVLTANENEKYRFQLDEGFGDKTY